MVNLAAIPLRARVTAVAATFYDVAQKVKANCFSFERRNERTNTCVNATGKRRDALLALRATLGAVSVVQQHALLSRFPFALISTLIRLSRRRRKSKLLTFTDSPRASEEQ
jgi:hypothetical protein